MPVNSTGVGARPPPCDGCYLTGLMNYGQSAHKVLRSQPRHATSVCAHKYGLALSGPHCTYSSREPSLWKTRSLQHSFGPKQQHPLSCSSAAKPSDNPSHNGDGRPPEYSSATPALQKRIWQLPGRFVNTLRSSALGNNKYLPMVSLFFCMSFINTILDSIGNSLVITAVGGGASVLPFLTVYAVWPSSVLFLLAFTFATQRFSRGAVFNLVIISFIIFYGSFGLLYPLHESFHLKAFADSTLAWAPAGMAGAVGMLRNWSFTLFYCSAELWGDVVLSLLFWGLANELTDMHEAPMLYPLFGIGANLGQTISGKMLSLFSGSTSLTQFQRLQGLMVIVIVLCCITLALHHGIMQRFPAKQSSPPAAAISSQPAGAQGADSSSPAQQASAEEQPRTIKASLQFLAKSPQIQCLGVMSLSQGLSTNLLDMAWKTHLHIVHPSPTAYAAFMGEVAMWTGIATGTLMCISPALFRRWGWKGVAGATPSFLLFAGTPFFLGCILFAVLRPSTAFGIAMLRCLVMFGALLQVFGRGAKFSMFKPAEEMIYIGLDSESRTKGKAAIDVVGAQSGKSAGAIFQQLLLVICSGSMTASMPFVAALYASVLLSWSAAVKRLDKLCNMSGAQGQDTVAAASA